MTAAERILARSLAASPMKSADWGSVQAGLRDRAFFSATVDDARRLAAMREACAKVASGEMSDSDARASIRRALEQTGYAPEAGKEGGLQDLSSQRRLDLIIKTNVDEAHGYVRYCSSMEESALAATPCQELIRLQSRKAPRDWEARWRDAGGELYGGRMIALKTAEIWTRISRFGHPWPPFDFGSGMGVAPVGRREAIRYGVISPDDPPPSPPAMPDFNEGLAERLPEGREKETDKLLRDAFGAQVSIDGDNMARWNAGLLKRMRAGDGPERAVLGQGRFNPSMLAKISDPAARDRVAKNGLTITQEWMRTHGAKHAAPKGVKNFPLSAGDYELIPSLWRSPDTATWQEKGRLGRLELTLGTLDDNLLVLGVDLAASTPTTFYKTTARAPSPA